MRNTLKEHGTFIGLIALITFVIIMLSTPEDIYLNVSIIDTNLYYKTPHQVNVHTTFNFYDVNALNEFPNTTGNWKGFDYRSKEEEAMEAFKTDTVLLRKYFNGERSVQFVLIKSENETILHDPEVCYQANKWNITKRGIEKIRPLKWNLDSHDNDSGIFVNKLSVQRGNQNEVVMYWYMWGFGLQRSVKNSVVLMISTPVYYNEPDETYALNNLKDFASEIVPVMYKPKAKSEIIAKQIINEFGIFGIIMEISVIALLIVLIFYNKLFENK